MSPRSVILMAMLGGCGRAASPASRPAPRVPAPLPAPTSHHLALPWSGVADGCARTSDAHLACWGGRFPAAPQQVGGIDHVAGVAGEQEIYGWTSDGAVFYLDDRGAPRQLPGITDAIEVAVGGGHACARRRSGAVACWPAFGKNDPRPGPVAEVAGATSALEIAVTQTRGCLRDARGVACWKLESDAPVIERVADTAGATSLTGGYAGIAVTRAGAAPLEIELQPVALPSLRDVARVVPSTQNMPLSCALGARVTCWTDGKPATARDVPALAGASELRVGTSVCGEVDHGVVCWNPEGGDAGASTDAPVAVAGLTDATRLVACNNAAWTCAHRSNGHVVCWGQHDQTIDRVPVDIGTHDRPLTSTTGSCWGSWHDAPDGTTFDGDSPMYGGREWSCTKGPHGGCASQLSSGTNTTPKGGYGAFDDARDLRPSVHGELLCEADARGAVSCLDLANDGRPARRLAVRGVRDAIQLAAYDSRVCALERAGSVACWSEGGGGVRPAHRIAGVRDAVELVGGSEQACVRHRNGTVSCWGERTMLGAGGDHDHAAALPGLRL